jgi:hypothetical protein
MRDPEIFVSALFTLAMLSMAFAKDNPVFHFAEHVLVGVASANACVIGWNTLRSLGIKPLFQDGNLAVAIPMLLGLLLYARYLPKYAWLGRYSLAIMVATGAGLSLRGAIQANFLDQIRATFVPLNNLDNLILAVGVLATISYFVFTTRYTKYFTGKAAVIPAIGQWVMMVAFGSSFGNGVMGRLSRLIARMQFLLGDFLGVVK